MVYIMSVLYEFVRLEYILFFLVRLTPTNLQLIIHF